PPGGYPPSGCFALLTCVPRTAFRPHPPLTKLRLRESPLGETRMSALAQPVADVAAGDRRHQADGRRIDLGAAAAEHGLKPMTAKDRQRIAKHLYGILGS